MEQQEAATISTAMTTLRAQESRSATANPKPASHPHCRERNAASSSRSTDVSYFPESRHALTHSKTPPTIEQSRQINYAIYSTDCIGNIRDIESICYQHLDQLNGVNIATAFNRIAKTFKSSRQKPSDDLLRRLADKATSMIGELDGRGLSTIAWSLATLNLKEEALLEAIANETKRKIKQFDPQALSNTVWTFATLKVLNSAMMSAIAQETIYQIKRFNPQSLCNTAWAFTHLGFCPQQLIEAIEKESTLQLAKFNAQHLLNLSCALVIFERESSPLLPTIAELLLGLSQSAYSKEQLDRLAVVESAIRLAHLNFTMIPPDWVIPPRDKDATQSLLQNDVGIYLKQLARDSDIELVHERYISELDHRIDFTLSSMAIEVDGPKHFAHKSQSPLGSTLLRNRLLKSLGWDVISVPYWEWDSLKDDEKFSYLESLMPLLSCEY